MAMAMDQHRFVEVKSGQSWSSVSSSVVKDGHCVCLARVSLVDPASAAGQGVVVARVKSDTWNHPVAHLSARNAIWDMRPELVLDGEFSLHVNRLEDEDSAAVDVRFDFYVLPSLAPETVDEEQARRPWSADLESGLTHRTIMKGRDRVCLTRVSLVDPPGRAAAQGAVGACVHTATRDRLLAPLSAERTSVELRPGVVLDKEVHFYLTRLGFGCCPAAGEVVVRFEGYILALETTEEELEDDEMEVEVEVEEEYDYEEPVSSDSEYDIGRGEEEEEEEGEGEEGEGEESDGEVDRQEDRASGAGDDVMHRTNFVPEEQFVGGPEPPFAFAGSTAGFMRVAAVESHEDRDSCDKQIFVLYRYTRFSTASDGALEARRRMKYHQVRFIVPPAGDTARSLLWAGASLANLVYPGGHLREELQELWSSLIAKVSVPSRATLVEVFVDVGILRRADSMPDSMERLRATLKGMLLEQWPWCHSGMELHLPEPVRCGGHDEGKPNDDTGGGERPAKRRRVVASGEDCGVCLELLEGDDLAAWPGCGKPHVFHGGCLELLLMKSDMCPICRRLLYIEPKPIDAKE